MDLSGVKSRNHVRQEKPYKKGMGMIATYGAGPERRKCKSCANYRDRMGKEYCKLIPWAEINRKTPACGKYEERK